MPVYGPIALPSGTKVKFREAHNSDRRNLLDGFDAESLTRREGRLEEALAFSCLTAVTKSGEDQEKVLDGLSWSAKSDMLTLKDAQYYQAIWLEMFTIGRDDLTSVRETAKTLLKNFIGSTSA